MLIYQVLKQQLVFHFITLYYNYNIASHSISSLCPVVFLHSSEREGRGEKG